MKKTKSKKPGITKKQAVIIRDSIIEKIIKVLTN